MRKWSLYAQVRVAQLHEAPTSYDCWGVNARPPRVGDIGTIVDILSAPGLPDRYVVESTEPDGSMVWLADFQDDELDPTGIDSSPTASQVPGSE